MNGPNANKYFPVNNGDPVYLKKLDDVIAHKFSDTPTYLQGIIAKDMAEDCASKEYCAVNHFQHFMNGNEIPDFHLYELVREECPVRPYFDLEWDAQQLPEKDTLLLALECIAHCLQQVGCTGQGLSIFCASGQCSTSKVKSGKKASYHIICNTDKVFRNTYEHKQFIKNILLPYIVANRDLVNGLTWQKPGGTKQLVIDPEPYKKNQTFRLPFQSKWSSSHIRPLLPYNIESIGLIEAGIWSIGLYTDPMRLEYITLPHVKTSVNTCKQLPNSHLVKSESEEFDLAKELCTLLSKGFLTTYDSTLNLIFCLCRIENSDRMHTVIHAVCARSDNYETKWVNDTISSYKYKGLGIQYLISSAIACSTKDDVTKVIKEHSVQYNQELFTEYMKPGKHTVIDERYLGNSSALVNPFTDCINTLIIKSLLGTGKTVFIKDKIISKGEYKRI